MARRELAAALILTLLGHVACGSTDLQADARKLVEKAKDEALEEIPSTGELSTSVTKWLAEQRGDGTIESLVQDGVQLVPVALEIARTLDEHIDGEFVIEPVIQKAADDEAKKRLDQAIGDMPRVETIEGLEVGFKSMKLDSVDTHAREHAYLVLWRKGDHLLGFVYKSKREVDLEKLVKDAPRLVRLVDQAIGEPR